MTRDLDEGSLLDLGSGQWSYSVPLCTAIAGVIFS